MRAIELKSDWGTTATFEESRVLLSGKIALFQNLLDQHASDDKEFVLVPDTNALLKSADPSQYGDVVGTMRFRFVIVPTVLAELDGLKRSRAAQPWARRPRRQSG